LGGPFVGIGKAEPLKGKYAGFWSRRITDEHRLVYDVKDKHLYILQCRVTMKNEQRKDDFYPLMKVSPGDDYGVVTDEYWRVIINTKLKTTKCDTYTSLAQGKGLI
jgi:hypothetical protein